MNILIVGNGFDLSHYLPTKYDHFMDAMGAIEKKDTGGLAQDLEERSIDELLRLIKSIFAKRGDVEDEKQSITFEEVFNETRDSAFLEKTKELYETNEIVLTQKTVLELQYRLAKNSWYQYFKQHVRDVKTWIDFEQQINAVLEVVSKCLVNYDLLNNCSTFNELCGDNKKFKEKDVQILQFFKLGLNRLKFSYDASNYNEEDYLSFENLSINPNFCYGGKSENDFDSSNFVQFIQKQLEDFIEIFNLYLKLVIDKLKPKDKLEIIIESKGLFNFGHNIWENPDKIYSFNYTNTYSLFHKATGVDFLHGCFGVKQNIVLGISDLGDDSLKKLKAYGFTKYHQKLFKETDYLFLDKFKKKVEAHKRRIEYFEKDFGYEDSIARMMERQKIMETESSLDLNIKIWGHSLDVSDREYILDLFSLNDDIDRKVRVVIYYYDDNAKFSLLNNLLDILKKDKVEKWMKNEWLIFEKNPEVKLVKTIPEQTV